MGDKNKTFDNGVSGVSGVEGVEGVEVKKEVEGKSRREFIKKLTSLSIGGALVEGSVLSEEVKAGDVERILSYRALGNTGLKASDISFGAGGLWSYRVALKAMSLGINYFDTAPDYGSGGSEEELGKALSKSSLTRDKMILVTKMCNVTGYPGHKYKDTREGYIRGVEASLKRLKTDYIDFLLVHALGERDTGYGGELYRLKDEVMLEAYERLKEQGKVRYLGVSSHNYNAALQGELDYAIESGYYKLLMVAYNFKDRPAGYDLLNGLVKLSKKAKSNGVAFVAMKTLRGASGLNPELSEGSSYAQSAFKWVLSNDSVSCLVVTMRSHDQIREYIKASGRKVSQSDIDLLKAVSAKDDDCELGCNECEGACPNGVKVSSILRYNMYFKNYGMEKEGISLYRGLSQNVSECLSCEDSPCIGACGFNVDVKRKLQEADRNLKLA